MDNPDIYDTGTPKYQSATDIYDALGKMASGEEIGILSEMFADVSWENQDYYYADNGNKLHERWDAVTEYGDKMWLMDIAAWQLLDEDANDWVFEALINDNLAKRIGFRKIFIDTVLCGVQSKFRDTAEAFEECLRELNRFGFHENTEALYSALNGEVDFGFVRSRYGDLCSAIYKKLKGIRLDSEKQLIVESRALLTAYDDFMFGLKSNQYLYNQQERMYRVKVAELQAKYDDVVRQLLAAAQMQGIVLKLPGVQLLEVTSHE